MGQCPSGNVPFSVGMSSAVGSIGSAIGIVQSQQQYSLPNSYYQPPQPTLGTYVPNMMTGGMCRPDDQFKDYRHEPVKFQSGCEPMPSLKPITTHSFRPSESFQSNNTSCFDEA